MHVLKYRRIADIHLKRCCFTPSGKLCPDADIPGGRHTQQVEVGDLVVEANHGPIETYYRLYEVEENRLKELRMGSSIKHFNLKRIPKELETLLARDTV